MDETSGLTVFDLLIRAGALISLLGLAGLVWCIIFVARGRRAKLPDDEMRALLRRAIPLNLGALFLSVIGLMLVITGIFLS
ncbi:hypothetical protein [Roseobacter ponti]|uniref:Uncharacterized protein n=1 Tax=Roseobacter ponti TaxID=1891787 RepID=A0A858SXQ9_9RHOB|nr:hypothetical protein [Roseobacter ponti]QJF51656.1 hypothetical protein G3256_11035 [Roseobacter ponti]